MAATASSSATATALVSAMLLLVSTTATTADVSSTAVALRLLIARRLGRIAAILLLWLPLRLRSTATSATSLFRNVSVIYAAIHYCLFKQSK